MIAREFVAYAGNCLATMIIHYATSAALERSGAMVAPPLPECLPWHRFRPGRPAATDQEGKRRMHAATEGRWQVFVAACAGLAWGLAEASFFFVVPDVLISAYAIRDGRLALAALAGSLAGACLGGGAMFLWAQNDPVAASAAVDAVPFVPQRLFAFAAELSAANGGLGILIGSLSGVPYKIFAVQAPETLSLGTFLAWTLPGRAFRFALSATVAWALARWLRTRLRPGFLPLCWAVAWIAIYTAYWIEMSI